MFTLGRSTPYIQSMISAKGNAYSIWKIIDTVNEIDRRQSSEKLRPLTINGSITFENVCFSYSCRPTLAVLNDVSFSIKACEIVAIVDSTDSGKVPEKFSSILLVLLSNM